MSLIKTFARIRPSDKKYDDFEVTPNRIYVRVPEHDYATNTFLANRNRYI